MTRTRHPLLDRLLREAGATADAVPGDDAWQALLALIDRTYHDADHEHERNRLLFERNPIPVWVFDATTLRYLAVNDAMAHAYGYTRDELLTMRVPDVKLAEDMPQFVVDIGRAAVGHIRQLGVRKHRRKDGAIIEMDVTSHRFELDGRSAMIAIGIDVTAARQLEGQLRQAQKMEAVGQLAGGIAHDFNNILAVISANADFALDELGPTHPIAEDLTEIAKAATRAATLTRQLLAFSRKSKWQPKPLALNAVVTNIEAMLSRVVGEDVEISTQLLPQLGAVMADAGQIEQLVMNLVVNARDAMATGGRLVIETANRAVDAHGASRLGIAAGRYVTLAVRDTGCGMTETVQARIFEPFFTTKAVDKGTGLGLSTVFGIVQQCDGGIEVESELGRGSTFRIFLPRIDPVSAITADDEVPTPPVAGTGTVLVVEDDPQVRQVIHRYLTRWGYTLLEAPNGPAALALARSYAGPIDLLLTDLVMPEMDGRSLSRLLLVERPHAKILFMSGYTEHPALANAALGPDDDLVQKPFTPQRLANAVARALAAT